MRKSFWLVSAGLVALAAPAGAQDNSAPAADPVAPEQAAPENQASESEAIIVTAQGRPQILQDVPISVNVVSSEALQNSGATDIRSLNQLAPSLLVSSTGSEANGSARIRGIGTVGDNPGLESSVAVFIDGVYRSRSGIGLNELGEIERIEVLRGPQGTLFGRNASAGIINIVSKSPNFTESEGYAEATYGNYDYIRGMIGLTGPIGDSGFAYRVDGVYVQRDGFYYDYNNDTDVNDRDRWFVRGQLAYEPNDDISFRLIGDYTDRDEKCCGATYVTNEMNPLVGGLNDPAQNNIIRVMRDLGQDLSVFDEPYNRDISVSPGRGFSGETRDWGLSLEANWDFGGARLTSITAYRDYDSSQAGDLDYGTLDILYRGGEDSYNRHFKTFSQELRLQGEAFDNRLDWLVGAYYADEDLRLRDNLRFGSQYGRFATCRLVTGSALAPFYSPTTTGCLSATGAAVLRGLVPGVPSPLGAAGPTIVDAINRLDGISDRGSTSDIYNQNSRNYAFFTHNIIHITDRLDLTLGLRYTNERKKFDATFGNDNVACVQNQAALASFLTNPALAPTAGAILGLSCQGNSTAELNGVSINDRRSEDELTGTGVLSFKPDNDWLVYASYSRGYKAGGFNLDRSALKSPILPFALTPGGAQALVGNLQFDPETVNAYEFGIKYGTHDINLSVAIFRQEFENFQLNTFDGSVFIVQNVNGCSDDLGGADRDQSKFPTASNFVPPTATNSNPAAATGACAVDSVSHGVRSQGIEVEASVSPLRDLTINAGLTYADTEYRQNLVGTEDGSPLNPALRVLPGKQLSNAPSVVFTGALGWTPPIGGSGLTGLFYVDTRLTGNYNTGSDLFPQKAQDSYALVNARIGVRGPEDRWAVELWGQNLFNVDYTQVAFNSPFQEGAVGAPYTDPQFPGGRQIFSAYLAEPRTYGLTLRTRF